MLSPGILTDNVPKTFQEPPRTLSTLDLPHRALSACFDSPNGEMIYLPSVTRSKAEEFPSPMAKFPPSFPTNLKIPNFICIIPKMAFYCIFIAKYFLSCLLSTRVSKFLIKWENFSSLYLLKSWNVNFMLELDKKQIDHGWTYMFWTGNFKLKFFLKGLLKPPKHRIFAFFPSDVNFPDLSGFWEIPKDSKVIPIYVRNSQELGKIPAPSHTVC